MDSNFYDAAHHDQTCCAHHFENTRDEIRSAKNQTKGV